MKIKHFLQLIRYKNLLLLVFMLFIFNFFAFNNINIYFFKNFILLSLSILSITAFGNIINDIFDFEVDSINKPNKVIINKYISKSKALRLSYIFAFFGILFGIIVCLINNKTNYLITFILTIILLYLYSKYLKKIALIGNFIVSLLVVVSIFLVYIFSESIDNLRNVLLLQNLKIYMFFAFILNFIREIVKDIEDIDGDYSQNMKTLPIVIGKKRTQNVLFLLTLIPFSLCVYFAFVYFKQQHLMQFYILFLILIPLGYFLYKILDIKSKKEFHKLSTLLKIIMFFGILSILLIRN